MPLSATARRDSSGIQGHCDGLERAAGAAHGLYPPERLCLAWARAVGLGALTTVVLRSLAPRSFSTIIDFSYSAERSGDRARSGATRTATKTRSAVPRGGGKMDASSEILCGLWMGS